MTRTPQQGAAQSIILTFSDPKFWTLKKVLFIEVSSTWTKFKGENSAAELLQKSWTTGFDIRIMIV